jgi:hypothetical protein
MPTDYTRYLNANTPNATFNRTAADGPNRQVRQMGEDLQAVQGYLPYMTQYVNNATLQTANQLSDPLNQLSLEQYLKYAPLFSQAGADINRQNVSADLALLRGEGGQLARESELLNQQLDPQFYATRGATADSIQQLLASIDPSGALSATERDQLDKQLLRQNQQAGTAYTPSQTNIAANAMQYGQAGQQRKLANQGALTSAIMASNSFLPASRSGANNFGIATGKGSGTNNTGMQYFGGVNTGQANDFTSQLAQGLQRQTAGLRGLNLQRDQFEDDKLRNNLNMGSQMLGSLIGGVAACWVAREVYGPFNPSWLLFREWMLNESPSWFRYLYLKYGERFAKFISNKPTLKNIIRKWMNTKIS